MALPGFTAEAALSRSTRTYRGRGTDAAGRGIVAASASADFCEGRELDANYAHPDDCGSYISCDLSGRATVMPCASGLHYTEGERPWGHCDYPHLVNCDDRS